MNEHLAHVAYRDHIKHGRSVILVTETYQFGKVHLQNVADFYRYKQVLPKQNRIVFENGTYIQVICSSSNPYDLYQRVAGHRSIVALLDDRALVRLNRYKSEEFLKLISRINERTMTNG